MYTDLKFKLKKIGKNVYIGNNVYFRYPDVVEIGDNVIIDEFCYFTTAVIIDNNVHIGPSCTVIGGKSSTFIMKQFSGMAAGSRIICSSDDFIKDITNPTIPSKYRSNLKSGTVIIKEHGLLGTNTIVHPSITIGEGAGTGSGSIVTKDLDDWYIYIGQPCKKFKIRDKKNILMQAQKYLNDLERPI